MAINLDDKSRRLPDYTIFVLPPDLILRAAESQPLFKFEPISLAAYQKTLDKFGGKYPQQFIDNFAQKAFHFPVYIDYCSVSGKYCRLGASKTESCPQKN